MDVTEKFIQPAVVLQLSDALSERVDPPRQVVVDRV